MNGFDGSLWNHKVHPHRHQTFRYKIYVACWCQTGLAINLSVQKHQQPVKNQLRNLDRVLTISRRVCWHVVNSLAADMFNLPSIRWLMCMVTRDQRGNDRFPWRPHSMASLYWRKKSDTAVVNKVQSKLFFCSTCNIFEDGEFRDQEGYMYMERIVTLFYIQNQVLFRYA